MFAYMIHLEELDYPEYVLHIFYLKYSGIPKHGNMLGNSLPVGPANKQQMIPKIFGLVTTKQSVMHFVLHKVFPGILQAIISNNMVYFASLGQRSSPACYLPQTVGASLGAWV